MKNLKLYLSYFKFVFLISLLAEIIFLAIGQNAIAGPVLIVMFSSLALYFMSHKFLKSFAFTIWVFAFVSAAMIYPGAFTTWFGFKLSILIVPLIQIIMFGMGTTLCLADFGRVFKMPWPILVGIVLQFSVMPLTGYTLTKIFSFEKGQTTAQITEDANIVPTEAMLAEAAEADKTSADEMAAGVVLIGSCPGGVASNLMTFLAGGNVALSVTMTSRSTLTSPIMTPFLMQKLAGEYIEINFLSMMFGIINMIIVPIIAGLIANRILYGTQKIYHSAFPVAGAGIICLVVGFGMAFFAEPAVYTYNSKKEIEVVIKEPGVPEPNYALIADYDDAEILIEPSTATIEDIDATVVAKVV